MSFINRIVDGGTSTTSDLSYVGNDFIYSGGVVNLATDFIVTQNGSGDRSVNISAGVIYIPNSSFGVAQRIQKYAICENSGSYNTASLGSSLNFQPNNSSNPRIDLVAMKFDTSVTNNTGSCYPFIIQGTPAPVALWPTIPNNCIVIAQVYLGASYTQILTSNITDLRTQVKFGNLVLSTGAKIDGNADPIFSITNLYRRGARNGNFDIWQRGTSFTNPTTNATARCADGWNAYRGSFASNITTTQQAISLNGSKYAIQVQRTAGDTSTQPLILSQNLESVDSIKFRGQYLTFSFYAMAGSNFSGANNTLTLNVFSGTGTDENNISGLTGQTTIATQTFTLTNTLQKFTFTIPSAIANTVNQLAYTLSYLPSGTAGTNDYFQVAQFEFNTGTIALPFEPRLYTEQLANAKRYYETGRAKLQSYAGAIIDVAYQVQYKAEKRYAILPTLNVFSSSNLGSFRCGTEYFTHSFALIATTTATGGYFMNVDWVSDAEL